MRFSVSAPALFVTVSSLLHAAPVHALRTERSQERTLTVDQENLYSGTSNHACRFDSGWFLGSPSDPDAKISPSNKYFDIVSNVFSLSDCMDICTARKDCTGVEYGSVNGRCEIWKRNIGSVQPHNGYGCYSKKLTLYSGSETFHVNTWGKAVSFCESRGGRLATKAQWCSAGASGKDAIFGGQKQGDQWAPIRDAANEWVQVGTRAEGNECKTHKELGYGYPDWGHKEDKRHWESNYILCWQSVGGHANPSIKPNGQSCSGDNDECVSGNCNRTTRHGGYMCCDDTYYCFSWTSGDCKSGFNYCKGYLGH